MRRSLTLPILIVCLATTRVVADEGAPPLDVFDLLADEWSDNKDYTCVTNPHTITFTEDRQTALFHYKFAPDRSHWPANLHSYHLSPEDSEDRIIRFRVLEVGDDWLALEKDEGPRLGARVTPPRWRISLSNDDANYRWRLYGAPPGSHSLLRGVRCTPEQKIIEDESDQLADKNLDDDLRPFVGTFEAPGRILGRPVTYRAVGRAVLQGKFVHIELQELSVPSRYAAEIFIGKLGDEQYIAHWLDLFGPRASTVVGSGTRTGRRELTFAFDHGDHIVTNVFRFHPERMFRAHRFDLVTLSTDTETGEQSETAAYEFKQVDDLD